MCTCDPNTRACWKVDEGGRYQVCVRERETDRQTDRQTDRLTDKEADTETYTER